MSDYELSALKRRMAGEPESKELRTRLYRLLLRTRQASEQSLAFAAFHGDELAQGLVGTTSLSEGVQCTEDLKELVKIPVTALCLKGCGWLSDDDLALLKGLPLKKLDLSLCHEITDRGLESIQGLGLEELRLRSELCNSEQFAASFIPSLDTSSYSKITDIGLSYLSTMPLRLLNLEFCHLITGAGLKLLQGLPLEKIFLAGFADIDQNDLKDAGLADIAGEYEDDD